MADPTCPHGRTPGGCEGCAYAEAQQRGDTRLATAGEDASGWATTADGITPRRGNPVDSRERAPVDLLVDAGDGRMVLVIAGDAIPPELADRPRVRRDGKPLPAPAGKRRGG